MNNEMTRPETAIEAEAQNSVMGILRKYSGNFKGVLPKHLDEKRCGWLVLNSIAQNPRLADCTPVSFLNSVILAANMGLEIRKNSAYLIPYGRECQLIIDYHGKMELARRAGVGSIHVELVREGDTWDYGFDKHGLVFNWRPASERGEVIAGFVAAKISSDTQINIMTLDEIEAIRRRAKSGAAIDWDHYGKRVKGLTLAEIRKLDVATMGFKDPYRLPWVTDYDRMARKTLIHRAANDWPMSAAMLVSQEADDAVDMGAPMPVADGMAEVMRQIDPADNRPMVDGGGDTREEQKAAAAKAGMEIIERQRKPGPTISAAKANSIKTSYNARHVADALYGHGYDDVMKVREADYDSIMARLDELGAA